LASVLSSVLQPHTLKVFIFFLPRSPTTYVGPLEAQAKHFLLICRQSSGGRRRGLRPASTWLTAACSLSARSQKQQPIWFPHWPTATRKKEEKEWTLGWKQQGRAPRRPGPHAPAQLTLHDHRLGHFTRWSPPGICKKLQLWHSSAAAL
jgi:hypothetical protein